MPDGIHLDASGLRDLGVDLERTAAGLAVTLPIALAEHARTLEQVARAFAQNYPGASSSGGQARNQVANSIRARPRTKREWRIEANDIALSGLWELGNRGSDPDEPTFRHPAFGRGDWYEQQKWPYLRMAVDQYSPILLEDMGRTVDTTIGRFLRPAYPGARVGASSIGTFLPLGPY